MANNAKKNDDRYPQMLRIYVVEDAANTFTVKEWPVPIVVSLPNGKSRIMNILRIFLNYRPHDDLDNDDAIRVAIADRHLPNHVDMGTPGVLYSNIELYKLSTNGARKNDKLKVVEYHDGNGHGYLYAKNNIYISVQGESLGSAQIAYAAIQFTFVDVSAQEYAQLSAYA